MAWRRWWLAVAWIGVLPMSADAGGLPGSRHDFRLTQAEQACDFCHTPIHQRDGGLRPLLWGGIATVPAFAMYGAPRVAAGGAQPIVPSRLCLSCHDGVNASAAAVRYWSAGAHALAMPPAGEWPSASGPPACESCHRDRGDATRPRTDTALSDHPISVPFPGAAHRGYRAPPEAGSGVAWGARLYGGYVECESCHNVHEPGRDGRFLRTSPIAGELCLACHEK